MNSCTCQYEEGHSINCPAYVPREFADAQSQRHENDAVSNFQSGYEKGFAAGLKEGGAFIGRSRRESFMQGAADEREKIVDYIRKTALMVEDEGARTALEVVANNLSLTSK